MKRIDIKAERFNQTYNDLFDTMVAEGFVFEDWTGTGLGSVASLTANGTYSDDGVAPPRDHWAESWDTGQRLPHQFFTLPYWIVMTEMGAGFFAFSWLDVATYSDAMATFPFVINTQLQFRYGVASRTMLFMCQIKVAQCLRNALCFDNRGRPVNP